MAGTKDAEKQQKPEQLTTVFDLLPRSSARPQCFRSTTQEILFILVATMGAAMPSVLQGCTIVISSFVGSDLNMTTSQITWMTAASALTSGSFLLFFGKVADLFGRRTIFIVSLFLFAVFALATGFSRNAITLDVLNGVLGLVCAATVPTCQGILGSIYDQPCKRRNYAFACFSAGNPLGFVFGSIFAGIATQLFGWRAAFWLLAIIYFVVTIIAYFIVPVDYSDKLPLSLQSLKQFDVTGTALTISGIGLLSFGLSIGSDAPQGWKTPYVLVFLILGVLMIIVFVWWECHCPYPLMPMNIWRDREFSLLMAILVLGFLAFPPMTLFVALYLQELSKYSALMTAIHMLPMVISGIIVNIIAGLVLHSVSNKLLMGIGAVAYTVAFLLVAVQRSGDSYWAFTFPSLAIVVVGADLEFNVANMYVMSSLPKSQQSIAGSIFQTATKLSVTIGLSIYTAIFRSVSEHPAATGYYAHDPFEPYAATFWCAMASTFASLLLVPFLKIKTQGHE
ncbi:major facilitator superfamily-domain-containing protein [Pseudomassariella vexata]|uniref:Major facilitator superfamily-domain-containing protein n=1 Tax=Pseudomassariella vexata TaxID=1141098 RepID=A0A1Y2E206_9PEZI|nr:major facilitator superfamily-domain-containing protein [Pseudomassariella vexata]ORY65356.1 major facilitator superfamily-domain-containing protein [Pseudomassariella vexata]